MTLFSFGYWGAGSATRALVDGVNEAEALRGFEPPLWVDIRISRSVRAAGFRDGAFAKLLGSNYVWMPDLGNTCVQDHRGGVEIRNPPAAEDLLNHALSCTSRRVIFFCACEVPADCHRYVVGKLVKKAAKRAGVAATVVEWPGGERAAINLEVPARVLHAVERGLQTTLEMPNTISLGTAAALPWGTAATLSAGAESVTVLLGPAHFNGRGMHFKILQAEVEEAAACLLKYGYDPLP